MPLSVGARLGPYEVGALLGSGGMGEVYRARDTKLKRHVAIKVLPRSAASDPERLARFQREAEVLAALNHPNIAAIYGFEDSADTKALVIELVEGPTLADRIAHGPIPLDDALAIAKQITEALEASHQLGIIHRDLKPANVKLRKDGTVKVLDFGLAKLVEQPGMGSQNVSDTGSLIAATTEMRTAATVVLGTAAYMSPEQATGGEIDRQSDIWSFGVVLFEMLTGRRLFEGDSAVRILASVLEREVDISALPPTPAAIRRVLERCLERNRKRRLHDIADVRLEIEDVLAGYDAERPTNVPLPPIGWGDRGRLTWWLAAGVVILAGLSAWALWRPAGDDRRPIVRSTFPVPTPFGPRNPALAISPDGTRLVYGNGAGQIYFRALDQLAFSQLSETSAFIPVFSPDGESIAFEDRDQSFLKRVSVVGGTPMTLTRLDGQALGIAWGSRDNLVFATVSSGGLMKVSAAGGDPERLTSVDLARGEAFHTLPATLPNGKGVLFSACGSAGRRTCQLAVAALDTGRVTYLAPGAAPRYSPTGHIVYEADGALRAVGFDQNRLALTGDSPVVVAGNLSLAQFDVAANGTLVYLPGVGGMDLQRTLVWVNRDGGEEPLPLDPRGYNWVRVSPDGKRLTAEISGNGAPGIWVSDISRPTLTSITGDVTSGANFPLWTPDGRRVVFVANGYREFAWTAADGTSPSGRLFSRPSGAFMAPEGWADDGRTLVFSYGTTSQTRIGLLSLEGETRWKPLIDRVTDASMLSISPDHHWIAYQSHGSGRYEVYVEPFPGLGNRQRVSTDQGGWAAVWSSDGREIFYRRISDGAMMAAHVQTTPELRIDAPIQLFKGRQYQPVLPPKAPGPAPRTFDVAPDGRFLMIKEADQITATEIVLVQNWTEELKRLASTR